MLKKKYALSDIDFGKEEKKALNEVINSKWVSSGPRTKKFEMQFSEHIGGLKTLAVSNCTAALLLSLKAFNVGVGDEVIVTTYTFIAAANCILHTGATPIFVDIRSCDELNSGYKEIFNKISKRTKAIIITHFAGYSLDTEKICVEAKKKNIYVIEDAAHGVGSYLDGKHLGTFGDVGCFSFYANKNLVTGEGGMVASRNESLIERIRLLSSHGIGKTSWEKEMISNLHYDVSCLGYNFRMSELNAAIGICQLRKLNKNNEKRRYLINSYRERLKIVDEIKIPFYNNNTITSGHIFTIIIRNGKRDDLSRRLKEKGIASSIHYPPIHKFKLYKKIAKGLSLPNAEFIGENELTLPLYPQLKDKDIRYITKILMNELTDG